MLTARQLANHFGVTTETIRVWARDGLIPYQTTGLPHAKRFYDLDEVTRYMRSNAKTYRETGYRANACWMLIRRDLRDPARRIYADLSKDGREWVDAKCIERGIPVLNTLSR